MVFGFRLFLRFFFNISKFSKLWHSYKVHRIWPAQTTFDAADVDVPPYLPDTPLIRDELAQAHSNLFEWTRDYEAAVIAGQMTMAESVQHFLAA